MARSSLFEGFPITTGSSCGLIDSAGHPTKDSTCVLWRCTGPDSRFEIRGPVSGETSTQEMSLSSCAESRYWSDKQRSSLLVSMVGCDLGDTPDGHSLSSLRSWHPEPSSRMSDSAQAHEAIRAFHACHLVDAISRVLQHHWRG